MTPAVMQLRKLPGCSGLVGRGQEDDVSGSHASRGDSAIRDRDDEKEEATAQHIELQGRGPMQLGSNGACERGRMYVE